jgi:hypothetical protein
VKAKSIVACPKCGGRTEQIKEGRTVGTRCTSCDWSVVTTYTPPMDLDFSIYEVRVLSGDFQDEQQVRAVAQVTGSNMLQARKVLQGTGAVVFRGPARSVARVRDQLLHAGVEIAIQPPFNW